MLHALFAAFLLILSSELGDRTFLLTTILSASAPAGSILGIFSAALGALTVVCLISVGLGRVLTNIVQEKWLAITGGAVLVVVGVLMLLELISHTNAHEEVLHDDAPSSTDQIVLNRPPRYSPLRTFSLIFAAEWGDRSQLTLIALAATEKEPFAVLIGAVLGHALCTAVACQCGAIVHKYLTLQTGKPFT